MPTYWLLNTQRFDAPRWQLHAVGCKDAQREGNRSGGLSTTWGRNPADAVRAELEEGGERAQGYSEADFQIMPCCSDSGKNKK